MGSNEPTLEQGTTMPFDRFWRWLAAHKACIVRAGGSDSFLYDYEDLHWQFEEDADHTPLVQLCRGKEILAEVALEVRDLLFVQVTPAPEAGQGYHLFEIVGGPKEDPYAVYHFLLVHGFEEEEPTAHRHTWKH